MKYLFLFFCFALLSCSLDTLDKPNSGNGSPPSPADNIKISINGLSFAAEGGKDSIITQGEDWHIFGVLVVAGDSSIQRAKHETNYYITNIKGSWFAVDKINKRKVLFSIGKNETGEERKLFVSFVGDNNFYTSIDITQSSE